MSDPFIADGNKVVATATGSVIATTISPAWAQAIAARLSGQKGALLRLVVNPEPRVLVADELEAMLKAVQDGKDISVALARLLAKVKQEQ